MCVQQVTRQTSLSDLNRICINSGHVPETSNRVSLQRCDDNTGTYFSGEKWLRGLTNRIFGTAAKNDRMVSPLPIILINSSKKRLHNLRVLVKDSIFGNGHVPVRFSRFRKFSTPVQMCHQIIGVINKLHFKTMKF